MIKEHPNVRININDLQWDPENPNEMSQDEEAGLRKSFTKFGITDPILIDQHNFIVHGNHRAAVLKELGATEIPAIQREFKDDNERRLCSQTMNKLHGEYEKLKDSNQLLLLFQNKQLDELAELIARPREELKQAIARGHPEMELELAEDNEELDKLIDEQMKRQVPDTELGDMYQLGSHRIICADSTDERAIKKLLGGGEKKADMIFTDPPYNIMGSSTGFTGQHEDDAMVIPFFRDVLYLLNNNVAWNAHVYICCNWRSYPLYYRENKATDMTPRNLIVWSKPNMRLGSFYSSSHELLFFLTKDPKNKRLTGKAKDVGRVLKPVNGDSNVWIISIDTMTERAHLAEKPVKLITRAIKNSSEEGQTVFDPFLGSGSTIIACEQTNRICYGVEIDPHYVDVAVKRWEAYTHNKATKLGGDT